MPQAKKVVPGFDEEVLSYNDLLLDSEETRFKICFFSHVVRITSHFDQELAGEWTGGRQKASPCQRIQT